MNDGKRYMGKPCRRCGGTLRYVNRDACVACAIACDRRRRERLKREGMVVMICAWILWCPIYHPGHGDEVRAGPAHREVVHGR